jgi:hypothetical protein
MMTLGDLFASMFYRPAADPRLNVGMTSMVPEEERPPPPAWWPPQQNAPVDQIDRLPPTSPYDRNAIQPNDLMQQYFDPRDLQQERI